LIAAGYPRRTDTRSYAAHVRSSVTAGSPTFRTLAWTVFPPTVPYGRPTIAHSPVSSVKRSPTCGCIGRTDVDGGSCFRSFLAIAGEHRPRRMLDGGSRGRMESEHLADPGARRVIAPDEGGPPAFRVPGEPRHRNLPLPPGEQKRQTSRNASATRFADNRRDLAPPLHHIATMREVIDRCSAWPEPAVTISV
jgi:hypothetical protein